MKCEYCDEYVQQGDQKYIPDDLPNDIPDRNYSTTLYHHWCFDEVIDEERREIAAKHGGRG